MGCSPRSMINSDNVQQPTKDGGNDLTKNVDIGSTNPSEKVSQNTVMTLHHNQDLPPPNQVKQSTSMVIQYKKGDMIGSGAYGKVYSGLILNTGQVVAIKSILLPSEKAAAIREIEAIKNEISLLKGLQHDNIVRYIFADVTEDKKSIEILLEYVPNGSVKSLLEKHKKLPENVVRIYTKQILDGLSYLHSKGIIHRDLKCANILVDKGTKIKLTDFGSSKRLIESECNEDFEVSKSLKGSPFWMAPEVVQRVGHNKSADIWSVGCVVIEMISGKPPWTSAMQRIEELFLKIARTKEGPPYPSNLSVECIDFLNKCFVINPEKRPSAEELLNHPFITGSESNPITNPEEFMKQLNEQINNGSNLGENIILEEIKDDNQKNSPSKNIVNQNYKTNKIQSSSNQSKDIKNSFGYGNNNFEPNI